MWTSVIHTRDGSCVVPAGLAVVATETTAATTMLVLMRGPSGLRTCPVERAEQSSEIWWRRERRRSPSGTARLERRYIEHPAAAPCRRPYLSIWSEASMSEFLFLYRNSPAAREAAMGTPEQRQKSMQRWMAWM